MEIPKRVRAALKKADRVVPWALVYRGDEFECPCCGGRFRRLRSQGGRPNARCPNCWALERHRVLWLYVRDRTDLLTAPQSLLHFAAEPGFEDRLRERPNLDYVSADLYPKSDFQIELDITDLPYEDDKFDIVMANHVFGEVPDDRKAMREVLRVLKPGGRLISQTAIDHSKAETVENSDSARLAYVPRGGDQAVGSNIRRYGNDYADRLREAGFEVELVQYVRELDDATLRRHALVEQGGETTGNDIFISTKPAAGA
jgi:predicted SAM-dependent methyltransferase